jgi:hypothetical protein
MKTLHRKDLLSWSVFNAARNIDFNSFLWVREGGNVLIDPLPLSDHDAAHLEELGGASVIVVTNSDHTRATAEIAVLTGATVCGPIAERDDFPIACDRWLEDSEEVVPGLIAIELRGSKTPGELFLLIENDTLITGDLVRSHVGGTLRLLPEAKLTDIDAVKDTVRRLLRFGFDAVVVGDGWHVFRNGYDRMVELVDTF